jgi:hypothetical protein
MKKFSFAILFVLVAAALIPVISGAKLSNSVKDVRAAVAKDSAAATAAVKANASETSVYDVLNLEAKGLSRSTFEIAVKGFQKLKEQGKVKHNKLTIVDFSKPSTQKRLYVIDLEGQKLLFNTLVAHGRNTGTLMATNFSNTNSSNQSSLGFYVTAEKYIGKHGLSMRMDGMEAGLNNNARERAIVMHAADYVSENFAKSMGFIGRSWGCPAVNPKENKPIVETIANGSVLFIYNPKYEKVTNFLEDTAAK